MHTQTLRDTTRWLHTPDKVYRIVAYIVYKIAYTLLFYTRFHISYGVMSFERNSKWRTLHQFTRILRYTGSSVSGSSRGKHFQFH